MNLRDKCGLIKEISDMLRPTFIKHKYLLDSKKDNPLAGSFELMDAFIKENKLSLEDIERSLGYLIDILYNHYGRKVVLLIDDYDRVLNSALENNQDYSDDVLKFLKSLMDCIKDNDKLLSTLLFRETRLIIEETFIVSNHLVEDSVTQSELSDYFGFTESEVDLLVKKLIGLKPRLIDIEVKNSVKKWYNGYYIGNQTIYSSQPIMNCFNALFNGLKFPYKYYIFETGIVNIMRYATTFHAHSTKRIEELIIFGQIEVDYHESFRFQHIISCEKAQLSFMIHSDYIVKLKNNI